jgi:hypothetical protein
MVLKINNDYFPKQDNWLVFLFNDDAVFPVRYELNCRLVDSRNQPLICSKMRSHFKIHNGFRKNRNIAMFPDGAPNQE